MEENKDSMAGLSDEEVRIVPPDYALKKIIGENVDIHKIFSGENLEKAQQVIDDHRGSFMDWVKKDIEALEHHFKAAQAHLEDSDAAIKKLSRAAFVIKSQAGTFGFALATRIAKSLDDFCTIHFRPKDTHMVVVRKHIDALQAIFGKNVLGDGGEMGTQLMGSLEKLVQKYKK